MTPRRMTVEALRRIEQEQAEAERAALLEQLAEALAQRLKRCR